MNNATSQADEIKRRRMMSEHNDIQAKKNAALREKAEKKVAQNLSYMTEGGDSFSEDNSINILHELCVHQIELEMQNEELRLAQVELETSRAQYFELFDLAPVGYVTISEKGMVQRANLTVSNLLGVTRTALVGKPFSRYIIKDEVDIYHLSRKHLMQTREPRTIELRLQRKDGSHFWAEMGMTATQETDGTPFCLAVLSDITDRKKSQVNLMEKELRFLSRRIIHGQEDERKSLSRELHDSLGQKIVSIQLEIEWLKSRDPERADKDVYDNMVNLTIDAVDELQRICKGLRPLVMDKVGFNAAVKSLLEEFETNCDMLITARISPIDESHITPEISINLYRIIQESLSNVLRHAKTKKAFVSLREEVGKLILDVRDEGCGLSNIPDKKLSFGLLGMRERANMAGGRFEIDSEPGKGTRIKVMIPVGPPFRRTET